MINSFKAVFLAAHLLTFLLFPPFPTAVLASLSQSLARELAKKRVNDAIVVLGQVSESALAGDCKTNLQSVQTGLVESDKYLGENNDVEALGELNVVESALDSCIASMADVKTSAAFDARTLLRRVSTSISNAEELVQMQKQQATDASDVNSQMWAGGSRSKTTDTMVTPESANRNTAQQPDRRHNRAPSQPKTSPLSSSFAVDFCAKHIRLQRNNVIVRLDKTCGAKVHSIAAYSSGLFSARIRTPVKATGVINSFYLSSNDLSSDTISFDFLGKYPNRISTNFAVNGNAGGHQEIFVLPFDTSVNFHTYTIKWDGESIVWLVDNTVLRVILRKEIQSFPTKAGNIYFYTWDASFVGNGAYAGKVDWSRGPFITYYTSLMAIPSMAPGTWNPPSMTVSSVVPIPMRPFAIEYCFDNIAVASSDIAITFDKLGCGGRFRSIAKYPSGRFAGNVKCAAGDTSGLITSFYLSSLEGSKDQDEIDFEWLGKNKNAVQTNFYVNGIGNNEVTIDLGFDCSKGLHTYTISYNSDQIQWLVDNRIVRTVTRTKQALLNKPYPVKPVYLYASIWNASSIYNGEWAGKWHGMNLPFTVLYTDITIQSP